MLAKETSGINYWPSFVDIFASLFFIFLILFAVYYGKEGKAIKEIKNDIEDLKSLLRHQQGLIDWDAENNSFVINESFLFEFNKSDLSEAGKDTAKQLGKIFGTFLNMKGREKKYSIIIEGHTDSSGSPDYNNTLSLERANNLIAEMKYSMIGKISSTDLINNILIPVGYGERKLKVEPHKDDLKCAANRRVEIKIIPKFSEAASRAWNDILKNEY